MIRNIVQNAVVMLLILAFCAVNTFAQGKLYFIKDGKALCKEKGSTYQVGSKSVSAKAIDIADGKWGSEEAIAIVYEDGKCNLTRGSTTGELPCTFGKKVVSVKFCEGGVVFKTREGKSYHSKSGGCSEVR